MERHEGFWLEFDAKIEPRGGKIVATIQIINGETRESLTQDIDVAYLENGRKFVRKAEELWERAYRFHCPCCNEEHPLPLPFIQALVIIGEGMIKAKMALDNFPRDINLN